MTTYAETVEFLNLVLPHEGLRVACAKFPKGMGQRFVCTNTELAHVLLGWSNDGLDTYHACASFKDHSGRTHKNVCAVRSLWLDIDTKITKSNATYANHIEAAQAVGRFHKTVDMPPPSILVNSGGGLHVYWSLDKDLTLQEWLPYAVGLKNSCVKFGLAADPARTADASSILRTPGTTNFK
jgi:hypothetical protein